MLRIGANNAHRAPAGAKLGRQRHRSVFVPLGQFDALGGSLPLRTTAIRTPLTLPADEVLHEFDEGSNGQEVSTTTSFLVRHPNSTCFVDPAAAPWP